MTPSTTWFDAAYFKVVDNDADRGATTVSSDELGDRFSLVFYLDQGWKKSRATPRALVVALARMDLRPADVELVHFFTDHAEPHDAQGQANTRFRRRSFFVGADVAGLRMAGHDALVAAAAAIGRSLAGRTALLRRCRSRPTPCGRNRESRAAPGTGLCRSDR